MSGTGASTNPFNPKLIAGVIVAGVIAFVAMWALIALGPQISSGNNGGGHALSKAAPGFAGIVDLIDRTDRSGTVVDIRRSADSFDGGARELLVLTPTQRTRPEEIARLVAGHGDGPVLLILPKWEAMRVPGQATKPGWVGSGSLFSPSTDLIPPAFGNISSIDRYSGHAPSRIAVDFPARDFALPLPLAASQTVAGEQLVPLIKHPEGGILLARLGDGYHYILAEPDLINNLAFHDRDSAVAALNLIDAIAEDADADRVTFDVTLNGLGGGQNLLRYAFIPPFIGITLCLIGAALLALWQAWIRFGPALKPQRAIPISKAALITNSAELVAQAGRELDGAGAYVADTRAALARRLHTPPGFDKEATDHWIDRLLAPGRVIFSTLAQRLPLARNNHEMLADAQALHRIRKELLRER